MQDWITNKPLLDIGYRSLIKKNLRKYKKNLQEAMLRYIELIVITKYYAKSKHMIFLYSYTLHDIQIKSKKKLDIK